MLFRSTGDNPRTAAAIAESLGIEFKADMLPEDKLETIRDMSENGGVIMIGDGRTLRTLSISVLRPKTVDVNVTGVHTLQLECFGSGNSVTGGEAVAVAWGNARVSGGH